MEGPISITTTAAKLLWLHPRCPNYFDDCCLQSSCDANCYWLLLCEFTNNQPHDINSFLGATRSIEPISYGNVSGWLAGWLDVHHRRYCIKTTKPILKLFRPSGSPIVEAFGTPYADTKFRREPLHRGRLIHGGGKMGDFVRFSTVIAVYLGNGAR